MKFWCKLPEDGDNARNKVMERMHRLYNCAFVGLTSVIINFQEILVILFICTQSSSVHCVK